MPPKILFRAGLGLLLLAVVLFSGSDRWLKTRIFKPLDMPVSLDPRQIKSPPFTINLREDYVASLDLDYSIDDWYEDRCNYGKLRDAKWRVYRFNRSPGHARELWDRSAEFRPYFYYFEQFHASPGRYELEWDIPEGAACLNPRHPHIRVYTSSAGYEEAVGLLQLFCTFLIGTGIILLAFAVARFWTRVSPLARAPRMLPDLALRNVLPRRKLAVPPLIHGLPHWGLFMISVLWILFFVVVILRTPLTTNGLLVSFPRYNASASVDSPWKENVSVYVLPGRRFFVNGKEVERDELRARLLDEMGQRKMWTVYFEADPDTLFMDAAYAIDTIQALGAKLIWLTPQTRAELTPSYLPTTQHTPR